MGVAVDWVTLSGPLEASRRFRTCFRAAGKALKGMTDDDRHMDSPSII